MLKITEPKKVLCIHDLSGVGRCSLAVILPVLSVMGIQPVALPTVMLSTHTGRKHQLPYRFIFCFLNLLQTFKGSINRQVFLFDSAGQFINIT